jgi:CDP-paratose 2-epimerase
MTAAARKSPPRVGLIEWLRPGENARAEAVCEDMAELGVTELRTHFSWADWHTERGREWYAWLVPYLSSRVNLLPCFMYTPPSLGIAPKTSAPPRDSKAFADFIDQVIGELGRHFEWIELWNEPNNLNDWDWHLDPTWYRFAEMVGAAAYWARRLGKRTVLGGTAPMDPHWLDLMCQRGVLEHIDAVGVHGFPDTWEFDWKGWRANIALAREVLDRHGLSPAIWITEAGYSTWRHDDYRQVEELLALLQAPAERLYWYSAYDLHRETCHQDGFHQDERHYHFGLKTDDGRPKLLYRVWAEQGLAGVRELARAQRASTADLCRRPARFGRRGGGDYCLITGGCGFIGTNLANRLLAGGRSVMVLDSLVRPGVEQNLEWLTRRYGRRLKLAIADVRDYHLVREAVLRAESIFHLAAQVAVTTSLDAPGEDFEVNAKGTLNLLEAVRRSGHCPPIVFTSTNKVYGHLTDLELHRRGDRWEPVGPELRARGVGEDRPLAFASPYGCSKGAADQYVLDFGRSYGIPAIVLRMSCIYGPHQFGTEDQGWIAHFLINALAGRPLTIYGDGAQVRDALYVDDLVDAFLRVEAGAPQLGPRAYNVGGGPANTLSLLELLVLMEELGLPPQSPAFADWRTADQRWYVSDTRRLTRDTGWRPRWDLPHGVPALVEWLGRDLSREGKAAALSGRSTAGG